MYKIIVKKDAGKALVECVISPKFRISIWSKWKNKDICIDATLRGLKLIELKKIPPDDPDDMYEKYVTKPFEYDIPDNSILDEVPIDFKVIYN